MIAELNRSDEVKELLAESTKQASITKKKKAVDGIEGELEENVAALCDLFENESFLEKGKVIKVFEEPHTKTLTLCFRNQLLKAKLEGEGRDRILFKKRRCLRWIEEFHERRRPQKLRQRKHCQRPVHLNQAQGTLTRS